MSIYNKLDIFNIYTTGIADDGVRKCWIEYLRDNIIRLIPDRYNINIYHYDPSDNISWIKDLRYENYHIRISNSSTYTEMFNYFNININELYLIIDCAHLFRYTNKIGYVKIRNVYKEFKYENEDEIKLNSLYYGYIIPDNNYGKSILKSRLFRVNNRNIITYIDDMIKNNITFDYNEPNNIFNDIFNDIRIYLINKWRSIYCKVDYKFDIFYDSIDINILTDFLLYGIKNGLSKNEIKDIILNDILYNNNIMNY